MWGKRKRRKEERKKRVISIYAVGCIVAQKGSEGGMAQSSTLSSFAVNAKQKKIKSASFLVFWFSWGYVLCCFERAVIDKQDKRRRSLGCEYGVCVVSYRSIAIPQGTRHVMNKRDSVSFDRWPEKRRVLCCLSTPSLLSLFLLLLSWLSRRTKRKRIIFIHPHRHR